MHLASITLILSVQFLLHNAAKIEDLDRVYKGAIAKPNSSPYQGILWTTNPNGGTQLCSCSLITTRYVLTAAHCLTRVRNARVVFGTNSLAASDSTAVSINIKTVKCHEKYDPRTIDNDIGVAELYNHVTLQNRIALVGLPKKSDAKMSFKDKYGKLTGWGGTSDIKPGPSSVLKQLRVRLVGDYECRGFQISSLKICGYGENSGSACAGDSGGPLLLEGTNTQIGIVSYGAQGCTLGFGHIYTNVGQYLEWIQSNTDYKMIK